MKNHFESFGFKKEEKETEEDIEKRNLEEFQDKVLEWLEEEEIIEKKEGEIIVDLEKIKEEVMEKLIDKHESFFRRKNEKFGKKQIISVLENAFKGKNVLSREDFNKNQEKDEEDKTKSKNLIYQPKDEKSAFNPVEIKKEDFYLTPWDLKGKTKYKGSSVPTRVGTLINRGVPAYGRQAVPTADRLVWNLTTFCFSVISQPVKDRMETDKNRFPPSRE